MSSLATGGTINKNPNINANNDVFFEEDDRGQELFEAKKFYDERIWEYNNFVIDLNKKSKEGGWSREKIDETFIDWYEDFEENWNDGFNGLAFTLGGLSCTCADDCNHGMDDWDNCDDLLRKAVWQTQFPLTEYRYPDKTRHWQCCVWVSESYCKDDFNTPEWMEHWDEETKCFLTTNMPVTRTVFPLNKLKYDIVSISYPGDYALCKTATANRLETKMQQRSDDAIEKVAQEERERKIRRAKRAKLIPTSNRKRKANNGMSDS